MAAYAMQNRTFRLIVATKQHYCEISNPDTGPREALWINTNKLLDAGFDGIKTGTTGKAGPCVCVRVKSEEKPLIVTVLSSDSSEDRWTDAVLLADWGKAEEGK